MFKKTTRCIGYSNLFILKTLISSVWNFFNDFINDCSDLFWNSKQFGDFLNWSNSLLYVFTFIKTLLDIFLLLSWDTLLEGVPSRDYSFLISRIPYSQILGGWDLWPHCLVIKAYFWLFVYICLMQDKLLTSILSLCRYYQFCFIFKVFYSFINVLFFMFFWYSTRPYFVCVSDVFFFVNNLYFLKQFFLCFL